jgi:hypothetical protein
MLRLRYVALRYVATSAYVVVLADMSNRIVVPARQAGIDSGSFKGLKIRTLLFLPSQATKYKTDNYSNMSLYVSRMAITEDLGLNMITSVKAYILSWL